MKRTQKGLPHCFGCGSEAVLRRDRRKPKGYCACPQCGRLYAVASVGMLQWSVDDVSPNARDPRPVVPFAEAGYNQARVAPTVAGLAAQLSARVDAQARGQAVAQGLPTLPEIRAERSRASSPTDGLRALGRQAARAGRPPSRTTEPTTPKGGDRR